MRTTSDNEGGGMKGRFSALRRKAKSLRQPEIDKIQDDRSVLQRARGRGREAWDNLKDRLPENGIGSWAAERFDEHPLVFAAGAIAAGIAGAALIPLSDRERDGFSRAGQAVRHAMEGGAMSKLAHLGEAVRDRVTDLSGHKTEAREAVREEFDEYAELRHERAQKRHAAQEARGSRRAPAQASARKATASSGGRSRGKKQPAKQRKRRSSEGRR